MPTITFDRFDGGWDVRQLSTSADANGVKITAKVGENITTNADNTQNLRFDNIGSVGVVAEGYPTNQTGKCVLTATGDWTLSGGDTSLKYGLYSGVDTIVFGFTNQTDTVEKGEDPNDPAIWRWFANGRCQSFISLNLQINGATRPSSLAPINGVTPARVLTDVINFTVQVI